LPRIIKIFKSFLFSFIFVSETGIPQKGIIPPIENSKVNPM
jgi:hypothetical protein